MSLLRLPITWRRFRQGALACLFLVLGGQGCAVHHAAPHAVINMPPAQETLASEPPVVESEPAALVEVEPEGPVAPIMGQVFAKTDFQGVVKTSFVRLTLSPHHDPEKTYRLFIGDTSRQISLPWDIPSVKPGYFLIDLPAGVYDLQSIAIPVGTTMAVEPMTIVFEVKPEQAVYLGTLQVIGTEEKIRFGGIPIIRPGFEYRVRIIDDREEALKEFAQRFPERAGSLKMGLMKMSRKDSLGEGL